jgi:hypothetical protein
MQTHHGIAEVTDRGWHLALFTPRLVTTTVDVKHLSPGQSLSPQISAIKWQKPGYSMG